MQLRRALVAGALVTAFLVPATAGFAQESPSTTTSSTTTSTTSTTAPSTSAPSTSAPSTSAPGSTTAKPDPDAFAALANQVSQNQAMLTQLTAQVAEATQKLAALGAEIDATQQKLDATRAEMARLKQIVRDRAAYIYQHADTPSTAVVDIQHVVDITAGKKYAESATQTDGTKISDLSRVSAQLDQHRAELENARAQQEQEKGRLDEAKAALEALTAHQKKLLDQAGAVPVMGDAELTAAEITVWFESRGVKYRLAGGMPIGDLVQLYMDEGKAEHVRPELAIAQSIIETGSFGNALDNNYAGIGACDSCVGEPAFPTPATGSGARSSSCATTPTRPHGRRTWPTRRRPRSTATIRCAPRSSTTPSSPRVAPRRGTSWATATGPPTRGTRRRCSPCTSRW